MQTVFQCILLFSYFAAFIICFILSLSNEEEKIKYNFNFLVWQTMRLIISFFLLYCAGAFDKLLTI